MSESQVLVEVWNRPGCQAGAQRLGYLEGATELAGRTGVDRDEWLRGRIAADQPASVLLRGRRVIRATYLTGTGEDAFEEWRLGGPDCLKWEVSNRDRFLNFTALGLHTDLTAAGPLSVLSNGVPTYQFTDSKSVSAWVDDIVAHLAQKGYGYIQKGSVDFSSIETIALDHWTPTEVANELERRTRGEWQLRRNGGTNYLLDIVARIGSSAPPVRFVEGQNLRVISVTENEVDLATEVLPTSSKGSTVAGRGISRTGWKVTALNGGTMRATLSDPNAVAGVVAISEDNQFNGETVVCARTGRPFLVLDTVASSQELELATLGDLVVGDYLERRADFTTGIERSDYEWNATVLLPRVTGVSTNVLTLASMLNATDPVPTTNWERGLRLRAAPLQHMNTVTSRNATTRELTLGSSHGGNIQVGDIGFAHTGGSEPYTKQTEIFEVESVTDTTHIVVKNRHNYHANAVFSGTGGVSWNLRIYRTRANLTYIESSDASANTVTVSDAAAVGIATNDVIEAFIETGGLLATTLPSPSAVALYDKPKVIRYTRNDLGGDRNLMSHSNPWFRDWSGGASALPDGWSKSSTGTDARIDAATVGGLYGPYVWQHTNPPASVESIRSLPIRPLLNASAPGLTVRFRIRPNSNWPNSGAQAADLAISQDLPNGNLGTLLAFTRIVPPGGSSGPGTEIAQGEWGEFTLVIPDALSLGSRALVRHGVRLHISMNAPSAAFLIDAVGLYYGEAEAPAFVEFDDGPSLWAKSGEFLQTWRSIPAVIAADIVDLYQADRVQFATKRLQKGGDIIIFSPSANIDTTVRAMSVQTDYRGRVLSECTLNTAQQSLSRLLAGAI